MSDTAIAEQQDTSEPVVESQETGGIETEGTTEPQENAERTTVSIEEFNALKESNEALTKKTEHQDLMNARQGTEIGELRKVASMQLESEEENLDEDLKITDPDAYIEKKQALNERKAQQASLAYQEQMSQVRSKFPEIDSYAETMKTLIEEDTDRTVTQHASQLVNLLTPAEAHSLAGRAKDRLRINELESQLKGKDTSLDEYRKKMGESPSTSTDLNASSGHVVSEKYEGLTKESIWKMNPTDRKKFIESNMEKRN